MLHSGCHAPVPPPPPAQATLPVIWAVALGGALGAVARWGATVGFARIGRGTALAGYPLGTLAVNVLGSFLLGYLVFHDRVKQLMKLTTGKYVAPRPIEDAFATSDRVEQVMVVGDDRKMVGALVVPDFEAVRDWADQEGIDLPDAEAAICDDDRVQAWIEEEVERINAQFEEHETVKRFELVPEEWTPENDLLTASMKIKRRNVEERFAERLDRIYDED